MKIFIQYRNLSYRINLDIIRLKYKIIVATQISFRLKGLAANNISCYNFKQLTVYIWTKFSTILHDPWSRSIYSLKVGRALWNKGFLFLAS